MTVTQLAAAAKVASQHISMVESGAIQTPREGTLMDIVGALGLTLPGFYGGERDMGEVAG